MNRLVKKRLYFAIFFLLSVVTTAGFLIWQLQSNLVFFHTPSDLKGTYNTDKNIWVGGLVKTYKLSENETQITHVFEISDNKNSILTYYQGALPSLFKINQGIVAFGKMNNSILHATKIAVKHDEVYMTSEQYKKIRNSTEITQNNN